MPSLKKVEHAQKKYGFGGSTTEALKKKRVRERVKYGWGTIPSLKKSAARQKNTGSAGPAQNREKKTGERTGQIQVRYHTVLKQSGARAKKNGFSGSTTES